MVLLVVGATGTLGRQIVRRALDEGYEVKCLVRNFQKASFLREWGAQLVKADLTGPESLPPCFEGVDAVIDAATSRPAEKEGIYDVDWHGKVALIQAAKDAGVDRFVFFSILGAGEYPDVPLMEIKDCAEAFLKESGLTYTIFRPCGFMQGLIGQYAIPILERQSVWVMGEAGSIAYMNSQDIAKFAVKALKLPEAKNTTFPLAGTRAWGAYEIIRLCERLAEQNANVSNMPPALLRGARNVAAFFQWTWDLADRLAFTEVSASGKTMDAPMDEVYRTFGMDKSETTTLEDYLQEYFMRILKKLKELDFESGRDAKKKVPF
ncbi:MAG: SDR family oxidoreductase [Cyanobacteria bacterium J06554_11]